MEDRVEGEVTLSWRSRATHKDIIYILSFYQRKMTYVRKYEYNTILITVNLSCLRTSDQLHNVAKYDV